VDKTKPLLVFEVMERWWLLLVDEMSLLAFEAMEGGGGRQWTR
jgi:hypothetical protein